MSFISSGKRSRKERAAMTAFHNEVLIIWTIFLSHAKEHCGTKKLSFSDLPDDIYVPTHLVAQMRYVLATAEGVSDENISDELLIESLAKEIPDMVKTFNLKVTIDEKGRLRFKTK